MISYLFNNSFTVMKLTETRSSLGVIEKSYAADTAFGTAGVVSGRIRKISGFESTRYAAVNSNSTHRLYLAIANSGLTTEHRIKYGSDYYNVISVNNPHEMGMFIQVDLEYVGT